MVIGYQGERAETFDDLSSYKGNSAVDSIVGPDRKNAFRINYEHMKANYDSGVDFQLREEITLLCPQTADVLYGQFTPLHTTYSQGTRPELEKVVATLLEGLEADREKILALMRFCRDLYKKNPGRDIRDDDYIFGGTEEELIEKGEELCECLGRLFVSLCEVAGIPAHWVIHLIGGHIVAEAYVDGGWAYVDPRCGLYFLKPDGRFASTWDIWNNPEILRNQPDEVKADVTDRWTWEQRIWKCENMYFAPEEITGFANYSLGKSQQYKYSQVSQALATELGLWKYNKEYLALGRKIFGISEDGWRLDWSRQKLRKVPLVFRNDGFTPYFVSSPPTSSEQIFEQFLDPMADSNVSVLEWGLGPGSVFCYDTKIGQIFGEPLTDKQWKVMRQGDRNVWMNVMGMIRDGVDPLKAAIDRGHEKGLKVFTRLEMNHEYGPMSEDNFSWVGLVGDFNKNNPQLRIPEHVNLDFKHPEVRQFKLAILREAAERGSDCISMDFAVYPPYFENPDSEIMTQFIRDVRKMADEVGAAQNRQIELMIRFPAKTASAIGIDWKRLMLEKLVDAVVPTFCDFGTEFDLNLDEFISMRNCTGVKVFGCIWQALGYMHTDADLNDEAKGRKYEKAKTKDIFYAQAMLFHRAGVDGIQLAMAGWEWPGNLFFDDLADPQKMLYADKRYMANKEGERLIPTLTISADNSPREVPIRIADDPSAAIGDGQNTQANILLYLNHKLEAGEKLELSIADRTIVILPENLSWDKALPEGDSDLYRNDLNYTMHPLPEKINQFNPDWWRVGEYSVDFDPTILALGTNKFGITFHSPSEREIEIRWIDLKITY